MIKKTIYRFATIGFVGLGNMGGPMAVNLAKKHHVIAYDSIPQKIEQYKQPNISFIKSIKDLAKQTNCFVCMLPNSQHSKNVCTGSQGIMQNAPKGAIIIDCSTISPIVAMELAKQGQKHDVKYVDAPVSGGVVAAQGASLTFMVGSTNQQIFEKAGKILECMGKKIFNCEKAGAGQIAKICNNMALAIQMIGVSQALAMGSKLGIDVGILAKIMSVSSARCWSLDTYCPVPNVLQNVPANRDYQRGFNCQLMAKDLRIAIECGQKANSKIELGQHAKDIYEKLSKEEGKKDFGIIFKRLSEQK